MREPWVEEDKEGSVTFAQVRTVRLLFVGVKGKIFLYIYRTHLEESLVGFNAVVLQYSIIAKCWPFPSGLPRCRWCLYKNGRSLTCKGFFKLKEND